MSARLSFLFSYLPQFLLFLLCQELADQSEVVSSPGCPSTCFCNVLSRIVYCSRRGLTAIPSGVPPDSLELNLNVNTFESGQLRRSNFSGYVDLRHLYLSDCGVTALENDTFADLTTLKWLDLSNNKIRAVGSFVFRGLDLDHLFLNGNRLLSLIPTSFEGLKTAGLYLHDGALTEVITEVLRPIQSSLKSLSLNGNQLVTLERSLETVFSSLVHIRLDSNPLRCNCELMWLKAFYDSNLDKFKGARSPVCNSPRRVRGRSLDQVVLADFWCQAPSFADIELAFGPMETRLRCSATGDPVPILYWIQPSGKATRYVSPINEEFQRNDGLLTIHENEDQRSAMKGMYICVANNGAGNATLSINLTWDSHSHLTFVPPGVSFPADHKESEGMEFQGRDDLQNNKLRKIKGDNSLFLDMEFPPLNSTLDPLLEPPEMNMVEERLFTLADIAGAVVGTHIFSLLIVFLVALRCSRFRVKPRASEDQEPQPVTGFMDPTENKIPNPIHLVLPHPPAVYVHTRNHQSVHHCDQL